MWTTEKCGGPASSIHKSHLGSHFPLALVILILGSVPESAWFLITLELATELGSSGFAPGC